MCTLGSVFSSSTHRMKYCSKVHPQDTTSAFVNEPLLSVEGQSTVQKA